MLIRIWRFPTLVLTALLTGITFCHVLEMPAKLQYAAPMYLTLHRTLYVAFGPPNVGVFVEIGAILSSAVLVLLVRRRPGFWPTLIGAGCLLMGLLAYFALVEPANSALRMMALEAPPEDWENGATSGSTATPCTSSRLPRPLRALVVRPLANTDRRGWAIPAAAHL